MSSLVAAKEHPFQSAGLGLAPFKLVGYERKIGPIRQEMDGCTIEIGAPGQPMGSCRYCGTGIADCYVIRSADGKTFIVGSDCVEKTYKDCALGVPSDVQRAIAAVAREKARTKRDARRTALIARFAEAVAVLELLPADVLADQPHPYGYTHRTTGAPLTRRDYFDYVAGHAMSERAMRELCVAVEAQAGRVLDPATIATARHDKAARDLTARDAAQVAQQDRAAVLTAHWRDVLDVLASTPGGFAENMARVLGTEGRAALSSRAFTIVADIVGKASGRAGSKKYVAAVDGVEALARAEPAA